MFSLQLCFHMATSAYHVQSCAVCLEAGTLKPVCLRELHGYLACLYMCVPFCPSTSAGARHMHPGSHPLIKGLNMLTRAGSPPHHGPSLQDYWKEPHKQPITPLRKSNMGSETNHQLFWQFLTSTLPCRVFPNLQCSLDRYLQGQEWDHPGQDEPG